jgi:hypothetical protein
MSRKSREAKRERKAEAKDKPMSDLARAYNEAKRNDTELGTPQTADNSTALTRATQVLQWVQIADSVDDAASDGARQIVMGELCRVAQAIDHRAAVMAELVLVGKVITSEIRDRF